MRAKWDRTKGSPEPIAALNRIIEKDDGEPLVDVRIASPSLVFNRPQVIPFLRKTVAEKLESAAKQLPTIYRFGILECWRPIARQQRIYDWHFEAAMEAFPGRPHAWLRKTVNRFVAPVNQKAPPGHCTGGAVDVCLLNANGETVDVSKPFDRFGAAPTYTIGLEIGAGAARMILVETMLEAGFSNCRDEWWHYSYGDAGWAVREGLSECRYGLVELPLKQYEEQEKLWLEAYKDRKNPFLKE